MRNEKCRWQACRFGGSPASVWGSRSPRIWIDNPYACGAAGSLTWPGIFGTWWQADPVNDLVMIYLIQHQVPVSANSGSTLQPAKELLGVAPCRFISGNFTTRCCRRPLQFRRMAREHEFGERAAWGRL